MDPQTKYASGTKPTSLSNGVPGVDQSQANQAQASQQLSKYKDIKPPQALPNQQQAPSQDAASDELMAAFVDHPAIQGPQNLDSDQLYPPDQSQMPNQAGQGSPIDLAPAAIENGLPAAASMIGTGAGAALGAYTTGGLAIPAAAEAGNAAAAAFNVAMAPKYKEIADFIRKKLDLPVENKSDHDVRVNALTNELVGMLGSRVATMFGGGASAEAVGKGLASSPEMAAKVAKNIEVSQAARDSGIDLGARGMMEGTPYEGSVSSSMKSGLQGMGAQDAIVAQDKNLDAVTAAFNSVKDAVGTTIDEKGQQIIKPDNIAVRKNSIGNQIGDIRNAAIVAAGDKKYDAQPLIDSMANALKQRGIDSIDGKLSADEINSLSPEAREIAAQYNSLMNKVKLNKANGVDNKISLTQAQELTSTFQKLAEFDNPNRATTQKQFGSMANDAKAVRDQYFNDALDGAADQAKAVGNIGLSNNLLKSKDRMANLNKLYGQHADAEVGFYKAVNDDPAKATENLIRGLGQKEYDNTLAALQPKEKGALGSAYISNLITESSDKNGVLVNPDSIISTLKKDGPRVKQLIGEENYKQLNDLASYAKTAEKIDTRGGDIDAAAGFMTKALATVKNASTFEFFTNLLYGAPKVNDIVKNTAAYQAAFERYNGGTAIDKISGAANVVAKKTAASVAPKVFKTIRDADKDTKNSNDIKSLELQFRGSE